MTDGEPVLTARAWAPLIGFEWTSEMTDLQFLKIILAICRELEC